MEMSTHVRVVVTERSQVAAARVAGRTLAKDAGFAEEDEYRAGLVLTELATNLVKHTREGGEVLIRVARGGGEMEILSLDRGPGIVDLARALADGHSSSGTPGTGLGAVRRLSESFDLYSTTAGTVVFASVTKERQRPTPNVFLVGAVSVSMEGQPVCGDLWRSAQAGDSLTLVVADGLGHGVDANQAAAAVLSAAQPGLEPASMLERMHLASRHTRGAAAAVAIVRRHDPTLVFGGVGNVAAIVQDGQAARHAVSVNGTLGHAARTFRQFTYPWSANALLVMATDGLTSHLALDRYPGLVLRHPALTAAVLYRDFGRGRDDATVVVVKEAA